MNFKEIRELAINLYKKGKSEKEIKQICKIPISEEIIKEWIQEKDEIEKSEKLANLYKKMKKIKQIKMTVGNKDEIIEELQRLTFKILEIDPNNQIAMNELIRCYSIKKEYELGRKYGTKLLKENPKNIFVLYNMAKLEMNAGDYEKSLEYNSRLLEIEPQNEQGINQRNLILEIKENKEAKKFNQQKNSNQYISETEMQEISSQVKEEKIEEEQKRFAIRENENQYNEENKKIYMQEVQKDFYEGKINKKNIEKVKEELYKYPNKAESAIFISELYYLITGQEDKAIEMLDDFIDSEYTLTPTIYHDVQDRISEFRNNLRVREQIESYQEKQNKETKIEQRKYMIEIAEKLNERKIEKGQVESIVKKLEKCQDRPKAIFLIIKIYEIVYGQEETLKVIEKYSRINNITQEEMALIVKMKTNANNQNKSRSRNEKIKDRIRKREKQKRYKKEILNNEIKKLLEEGKSVREIYERLKGQEYVSLKSIAKIRSSYIKKAEKTVQKYNESIQLATEFLKDGYSVNQIYDLFDYNIGKSVLNELKQKIEQKER